MFKINKLDFLVSVYIFCIAASELMGAKTFSLATIFGFHLNASVAIFVIPVIFTINDIIAEVYGKARARSVVWSGFFVILMIVLFSILATALPPSTRFLSSEKAYDDVFFKTIRISVASLIAFGLSDFFDVYVFMKIREKFGRRGFWLRNNVSNIASELVDTTVFMTLAFYALSISFMGNFTFLVSIILPYWLLKCSMSIIETPFAYMGVNWLRGSSKEEDANEG